MKKLFAFISLLSFPFLGFSQTPEIGHFQQLKTVRRGDTLDVAWYYKPAAGTDVRSFQWIGNIKNDFSPTYQQLLMLRLVETVLKFPTEVGMITNINPTQVEITLMCPIQTGL